MEIRMKESGAVARYSFQVKIISMSAMTVKKSAILEQRSPINHATGKTSIKV
jgi:hypothetical protein